MKSLFPTTASSIKEFTNHTTPKPFIAQTESQLLDLIDDNAASVFPTPLLIPSTKTKKNDDYNDNKYLYQYHQ